MMDTKFTENITCPFCGHEDTDSWESNDWSGTVQNCESCDEEFNLTVEIDVSYTTSKA